MSEAMSGGCFCGGVKYIITEKPEGGIFNCHCSKCRKTSGAPFLTFTTVKREAFELIESSTIKEFPSSDEITRIFCGRCGCSVLDKSKTLYPDKYGVNIATLDDEQGHGLTPEGNIFAKYKAPWVVLNEKLPKSDEGELWLAHEDK